MWLIVGLLRMKGGWRDAPFALRNFSRSNKYLQNFSLNWKFWLFGPNLPKKGISCQKQKKEHHHWISHIRISLGIKFYLKLIILTVWTKFAKKRAFLVKNEKSEHRHWILHIRIRLATKFSLKLIILVFWIIFAKKGRFQSKTKKVNTVIEFCIFELV